MSGWLIILTSVLIAVSVTVLANQSVYGQEMNSTEEASRHAREILCKEYHYEYCGDQEVNSTNSTNSNPSQYDLFDRFVKGLDEFMKEPITNDSQRVESITEQEYNNRISELNELLESRGQEPITLPYKESCYYHEDDKYLYETMQCIK